MSVCEAPRPAERRAVGAVGVIACIEALLVIDEILTHMDKKAALAEPVLLPQSLALPQRNLAD